MRKTIHLSGLLISLWEPANSLFVRDKYVTPTGKWLHAGYVQKAEARKTYHCVCVCGPISYMYSGFTRASRIIYDVCPNL